MLTKAPADAARVTADVVVIGGGGSGLAAAIEAASLGRRVVLIEKNDRLGGTTGRSIGSVTASNTPHQIRAGIKDSPDHHYEDLAKFNAALGLADNDKLSRMLVENVPDTFRWLMDLGIEFYGPMKELPHRKPRMHNVLPNSKAYIYHLERRARKLRVDIRTSTRARELVRRDGRVDAVLCDTADGPVEFQAKGGIVLATGDYSGSAEMRRDLVSDAIGKVEPINPTNTGDGHRMVLALGGRILNPHVHLAGIRFQPPKTSWVAKLPPYPWFTRLMRLSLEHLPGWLLRPFILSFLTTVLVPTPKLFKNGALLINGNGERFTDELEDLADPLSRQPDRKGYILLDGSLVDKFSGWPNYVSTAPGVAYAYIADYRRSRKDVFKEASSLGELAGRIGADPARLEKTVANYRAEIEGQPLETNRLTRAPFEKGPYVALGPVRYWINFTDGGVAVNERLEVVGADDRPLGGLYAAGFIGMGGILLEGHGHHLGWAFTSGRLAGRHAAWAAVSEDLPEVAGT
jgi:succinate dehydrogenase/fumarate reductase flavoprotein subunit